MKKIMRLILLLIIGVVGIFYIRNYYMIENHGYFIYDVKPSTSGDIFRIGNDFFLFDKSSRPAIEFVDMSIPGSPFKEEWMSNPKETSNRAIVRLFKQRLGSKDYRLVFEDLGQNSFLWSNPNSSDIYILVNRYDAHQPTPRVHYPTLWVSNDSGNNFKKRKLPFNSGKAKGLFFDEIGKNGYMFINDDIYYTKDSGVNWHKVLLQSIIHNEKYESRSDYPVDTVAIDKQGDFYFSVFFKDISYIYKLSIKENFSYELIATRPNEMVLNLSVNSDHLYYISFYCPNGDCHNEHSKMRYDGYSEVGELRINYLYKGKKEHFHAFKKHYRVHNFEVKEGKVVLTASNYKSPRRSDYILLTSDDFGKTFNENNMSRYIYTSGGASVYIDIDNKEFWFARGNPKTLYKKINIFNRD